MKTQTCSSQRNVIERIAGSALMLAFALSLAMMGCVKKEPVLHIDTPGAEIEINKNTDLNGDKSIEVETKKPDAPVIAPEVEKP